jgi:hypothetical protein
MPYIQPLCILLAREDTRFVKKHFVENHKVDPKSDHLWYFLPMESKTQRPLGGGGWGVKDERMY